MADTDQSTPPPEQTKSDRQTKSEVHHGTVAELVKDPNAKPPRNAYDDPTLSPKEFLLAVMRSQHLPLAIRTDAATKVAPYFTSRPRGSSSRQCADAHLTYVIGDNLALREGYAPRPPDTNTPDGKIGNKQSFSSSASHSSTAHDGHTPAPNIETIIEDLNSGNIPEPTLCAKCGHLMPYPCVKAPLH
jgi:hypothetical protein